VKFVPLETSNAGKEVSAVQSLHAPVKLMSSLAVVENNIPSAVEGKEVKRASVQPFHVSVKFVPLDRFKAGNDSSWEQLCHAFWKLISSSASVENVRVGKEVRELQLRQQ
jgi:hypothetical protein